MKRAHAGRKALLWAAALAALAVTLFPFYWMLNTSLKPAAEVFASPPTFVSRHWSLGAYTSLFASRPVARYFLNSLIVALGATALSVSLAALAAYGLTRFFPRGATPFVMFLLFTKMLPETLLIIPYFQLMSDLGLLNTYWALMLPNLISAFNLLVMRAFFQSLPSDIEESARIDGASEWQILWRIVLPLSKPNLATIGLFYAVAHWNGFFDAILYLSDANMQPLQVVLRSILNAANLSQFGDISAATALPTETLQMAAVVLTTLPVLLVYPFLQRYFVAGTLLGAVKE